MKNQNLRYLTVLFSLVGLSALALAEEVAHDEMVSTYTGTTTRSLATTSACWQNRTTGSSDVVAWKSVNDYAVFPSTISTFLCQLTSSFSFHGIKNESSKTVAMSTTAPSVGAGGVTLTQAGGGVTYGYNTQTAMLKLSANQTWSGQNASGYSVVSIGCEHNFHKPYTYSYVEANPGVTGLSISGRLAAIFYSPLNKLGNVDVEVTAPAELVMADATVTGSDSGSVPQRTLGKLNAKSVTFSGDGIRARFGAVSPATEGYKSTKPKTVSVIDSATLAPTVTLDSGADLIVTNTTFALNKLYVTGSGTSTISGSTLVFTNTVTEFAIEEGARLALAATPKVQTSTATIAVTGAGTFELASNFTAGTLAAINVASTATLAITGGEPMMMPITGSGKVIVNPGDGNEVFIDSLAGFSGTVEVTSGTLYLNATPTCEVKTSGTGSVNYDGSKYIGNQPVAATEVKVTAGETLRVYGNGLTAATRVWMNGGTIEFLHDAVVAASVTQDVTSVYRAGEGVTAILSGAVCVRTTGSTVNEAKLYGGDVVITGGFQAEGEKDRCFLYAGNVTFAGAPGYFCSNFGVASGSQGKKMIFDGVKYESTFKGSGSPTSSLGLRCEPAGSSITVTNGATLAIKYNRCVYFADWATLNIADGSFTMSSSGSADFRSAAKIKLCSGGLLETERTIVLSENATTFDWKGGTLRPNIVKTGADGILFKGYYNSQSIAGTVNVTGLDCVLDMSALAAGKTVVSTDPSVGPVKWVGAEGAKLAVKGPGAIVMKSFTPNGMSLELDDKADLRFPTLVSGFSLAELVINAQDCSVSTESTSVTPSVQTLRIGTNGLWRADLLSDFHSPIWTDMIVDTGAILKFSPSDAVLSVPGSLTFGESVRTWIVKGSPLVKGVVMTATGGIVGNPTWTQYAGAKRAVQIVGNDVTVIPPGLILMVR